jgi:hypothetical protein
MDGLKLVALWEEQHGPLSAASRQCFLGSHEAQKIRAAPRESVVLAFKRTPLLSEVVSDLSNAGYLDSEKSNPLTANRRPESRKASQTEFTRKIATKTGHGFHQAEEDQKK